MRKPSRCEYIFASPEILKETIDEKTGDRSMKVKMKFQHAGIINRNGRRYRKELLQREIDKLSDPLKEGAVFGAAYHPKDAEAETTDVSHIWHRLWMEEDGSCFGEATIVPTYNGKNIMVLIKEGAKIGVSSRGVGTVTKKTEKIEGEEVEFHDVNDDYRMLSPGDLVLTPSTPGADVKGIIEKLEKRADEAFFSEEDELKHSSTKINESEDNKPNDSKKKKEVKMNLEDFKKLKEENPDAYKEIQTSVISNYKESEEYTSAVDTEVEKQKKDIRQELADEFKEALDSLEGKLEKLKDLKQALEEGRLDKVRELLDEIMPKEEGDEENEEEQKTEDADLQKTVDDLKKKTKALEDELAKEKKAKEDAEKEEQLQKDLKVKATEVLEGEKYSAYKSLIEDEIFDEAGKVIGIESVEKTEEAIDGVFTHLSDIKVKMEKEKILEKSDLKPKGKVGNSDNPEKETEKTDEDALYEQWLSDRQNADCRLGFEEYKTKFGKK